MLVHAKTHSVLEVELNETNNDSYGAQAMGRGVGGQPKDVGTEERILAFFNMSLLDIVANLNNP